MFTITRSSNLHFLKFRHFNFSNFQTTFVNFFTKKSPGFKIDFESTDKVLRIHQYLWTEISRQWNNGPLTFFFEICTEEPFTSQILSNKGNIKSSVLLILLKILLWVILMEMKVSQIGCFQITGRWICYSIFFDISFIVFFMRLLSKSLWRNYPFSAQISKIHFKM